MMVKFAEKIAEKWKPLLARFSLEPFLVIVMGLCLLAFGINAWGIRNEGVLGVPLARLIDGNIQRKRPGSPRFEKETPVAILRHRDVVWVEEGGLARLRFVDGFEMTVKGGTYLVLNRSRLGGRQNGRVDLLSGEVEIRRNWASRFGKSEMEVKAGEKNYRMDPTEKSMTVSTSPSPTPPTSLKMKEGSSPEPSPEPSPSQGSGVAPISEESQEEASEPEATPSPSARPRPAASLAPLPSANASIHPKPSSILLVPGKAKKAFVAFSWPERRKGNLEMMNSKGDRVDSIVLDGKQTARVELGTEAEYSWKIVESGRTVVGPYSFRLWTTERHPLGELMKTEGGKTVIEFAQ